MYKSGLTQLIRWRLRTGIPRRAGVEGQLLFFWALISYMTGMNHRPTLGLSIGGKFIQVQYTTGSLVAVGEIRAFGRCPIRRVEGNGGRLSTPMICLKCPR
jgi:hypothetical protein